MNIVFSTLFIRDWYSLSFSSGSFCRLMETIHDLRLWSLRANFSNISSCTRSGNVPVSKPKDSRLTHFRLRVCNRDKRRGAYACPKRCQYLLDYILKPSQAIRSPWASFCKIHLSRLHRISTIKIKTHLLLCVISETAGHNTNTPGFLAISGDFCRL